MGQGVLTGIGGDAVSYPPPDFWAPAHESLQSRGPVDDVRLGRPLHLPPIPPGRRRVPFKCPGAGARAAAGAAAAAAPGPTAVPARHKRLSNHSGAGAHQRGGRPADHAFRLPRRLAERPRRWRGAQGGERRRGDVERLPREQRGGHPRGSGCGAPPESLPTRPEVPGLCLRGAEPRDLQKCTPAASPHSPLRSSAERWQGVAEKGVRREQ
ncbi:uncharacterized protein LOC111097371 isoform X2 [Canis lupus familiaris]|uniref:uncharacterized protein LOC111097371 isoform X2 n=1 Tax=Canis lupus familiaris TaxID=9615 RepID=UPI0018F50CA1|nr:uncharacterized protein LOC111097371 isoform X2 [Canis lupus familiaris]